MAFTKGRSHEREDRNLERCASCKKMVKKLVSGTSLCRTCWNRRRR